MLILPVGFVIEILADLEGLGREDSLEGLLFLTQNLDLLFVVLDLLCDGVHDFLTRYYSMIMITSN